MRAAVGERVHLAALADEEESGAVGERPLHRPVRERARGQRGRPLLRQVLKGGLVDADALSEREVAAEPGRESRSAVTERRQGNTAIAPSTLAGRPRERVEDERRRVADGV